MNKFEIQYLSTMKQILDHGDDREDRTGIGSRAIWGTMIDIDLADGFPIVTTRKSPFRLAFEETIFFMRGQTDTTRLEAKKVNIWKGNTSTEFLEARGLGYLPEGNLGKGYGFQWRNFGGDYKYDHFDRDYNYSKHDGAGVDQLAILLDDIKDNPGSRRHIITGWNPQQLHEMALPPCHLYQQYQVINGRLNSMFLMRSWDFLYGAPFNIMGYAFMNHVIAKYAGLKPGRLLAVGNDVHLYANQIEIAREQIKREPFELPTLTITKELHTLDDILSMEFSDMVLEGYQAHPDFKNKPGMAV